MRTIARFMDARNTAEGKFLSVLLSVLLVFSFLNVTMFTDYANATDENAPEATVEENQSLDAVDPAADESEGDAQPESEEPEAEVNESGAKEPEAAAEQEPSSDRETVYADAPVVEEQEAPRSPVRNPIGITAGRRATAASSLCPAPTSRK